MSLDVLFGIDQAMTRIIASALALPILLAAPLSRADPSASCCFTGSAWYCADDGAVDAICEFDPFCCVVEWDDLCVYEYEQYHDWTCPPLFQGVYTAGGGDVEVSEFGELACGGADPNDCQWTVYFDLPADLSVGSSSMLDYDFDLDCDVHGGGGIGPGLLQIFSDLNGVVRGMLQTDWLYDLEGACAEPIEGLRIEVVPRISKNCFVTWATPRCDDPSIESCVCHDDPYCCDNAWDGLCVAAAGDCP